MKKINIGLFLSNLIFLGLYSPLNQPKPLMFVLETKIDQYIPFIPFFIVPYISFYIFLPFTIFSLRNEQYGKNLYITLCSSFITIAISYFFYYFFQTHVIRPPVEVNGFFLSILSSLYTIDNPYNGFPSIHTSLSTIGIFTWVNRGGKYSNLFIIWAIIIIISTLLVKQHYITDTAGGIILASLIYCICTKLNFFGKNL